jgi:hypothetical protein
MGRFSLFVGYYGVQGRGGTNDAKGWNSIDEGRWKEGRRREDRRWWRLIAKRSRRFHEQRGNERTVWSDVESCFESCVEMFLGELGWLL